jgi:hypothetical protein
MLLPEEMTQRAWPETGGSGEALYGRHIAPVPVEFRC